MLLKKHVSEIVDISDGERDTYFSDIAKVAKVIHKIFKAKKINYGTYGDTGSHLHFHLVPKYEDDEFEWQGVFAMNPERKYLDEDEYKNMIDSIKKELDL